MRFTIGTLALVFLLSGGTSAQSAPAELAANTTAPPVETAPPTQMPTIIPAGTPVEVELTDPISTRTNHIGDTFGLRLRTSVFINDHEVLPAGALGGGEVIDSVQPGIGGRQGRLIIAARYLEVNGQRVRIRGMQIAALGADHTNDAMGLSMMPYVGWASIFVHGGNIEVPAGAQGTARFAADVDLTSAAAVAPPAMPENTSASGENQQ